MKNNNHPSVLIHGLIFLILAQNISAIYPLSNKKCYLQDSYCLTKQSQATLKPFLHGVPELGIKPFNKMHLDFVEVNKTEQNKLHYQMNNTIIEGFNNTIIDEISINMDFKIMRISFHSTLISRFDYMCEGEIYGFPIFGNGKGKITMNNLQVELVGTFDIAKNKQGKDIMYLKKLYYGADAIEGVHHYFGNLFNGDKVKSELTHKIINNSWRTVVANYGRFFTVKVLEEIFEAIKIYLRSWPLEDLAIY